MFLTHNPSQTSEKSFLTDSRRLHFYDKGESVPLADGGVWQVYRGVVQLSQILDSGEEILLGWVQSSGFFGLWLSQIDFYQAKALSDLYLRWYSLDEIETSSQLSQMILSQMVSRLRQTEALLAISGLKRVEDRLQSLLQLLKEVLGESVASGTRLIVRLTHQNLADTVGTTRVTVTRLLGEFQRQGLISLDSSRHIIIHQMVPLNKP